MTKFGAIVVDELMVMLHDFKFTEYDDEEFFKEIEQMIKSARYYKLMSQKGDI